MKEIKWCQRLDTIKPNLLYLLSHVLIFGYYSKSILLRKLLIKLTFGLLHSSFPGIYIKLGSIRLYKCRMRQKHFSLFSSMEQSGFKVCYLQERVPLDQQVLDLLGHGVKHQLQVHTLRLHQLLPLKRQHHTRVLGHLRGQFIRSLREDRGTLTGTRSQEKRWRARETCANAPQRGICF